MFRKKSGICMPIPIAQFELEVRLQCPVRPDCCVGESGDAPTVPQFIIPQEPGPQYRLAE